MIMQLKKQLNNSQGRVTNLLERQIDAEGHMAAHIHGSVRKDECKGKDTVSQSVHVAFGFRFFAKPKLKGHRLRLDNHPSSTGARASDFALSNGHILNELAEQPVNNDRELLPLRRAEWAMAGRGSCCGLSFFLDSNRC